MKIAIFGSRTLCDERVEKLIQQRIETLNPDEIITSGETSGVNEIARNKARENKITLTLEWANNAKYSAGKYEHRSINILKRVDYSIFIHDGKSKGTKNEIMICKKMNKPFEYNLIEINDNEDLDWSEIDFNWNEQK